MGEWDVGCCGSTRYCTLGEHLQFLAGIAMHCYFFILFQICQIFWEMTISHLEFFLVPPLNSGASPVTDVIDCDSQEFDEQLKILEDAWLGLSAARTDRHFQEKQTDLKSEPELDDLQDRSCGYSFKTSILIFHKLQEIT